MDRLGMLLLIMLYETLIKPWRYVSGLVKWWLR